MKTPRALEGFGMVLGVLVVMFGWAAVAGSVRMRLEVAVLGQQGMTAVLAAGYAKARGFSMRETFSLRWPGGMAMLAAFCASVAMFVLMMGLGPLLLFGLEKIGHDVREQLEPLQKTVEAVGKGGFLSTFFLIACVPGVCEEFLFRGFVFSGFASTFGRWCAVVPVALLFAAMHMSLPQGSAVFFLGIHFGVILVLTRSLYASILAHIVNNGAIVALQSVAPKEMDVMGVPEATPQVLAFCVGAIFVGAALYGPCILWLRWLRKKAKAEIPVLTAI